MSNADRKFEMEIELAASPEQAWAAIADAREIARWFAPTAELEPKVGGRVLWQWGGHHVWPQTIEVFEPGRHLRTRYDSMVDDGQGGKRPLFVDFFLTGSGGTTTLRLVHSGFGPEADFDAEWDGISGGWPVELRSLQHYLEHHRGKDRMVAWSMWKTKLPAEEAWARLTGKGGLALGGLHRLKAGEAYSVDVPGAGTIAGKALYSPSEREFSGTAATLDNGWFRVHCDRWGDSTEVWLWLAVYDGPRERVAKYERAFDNVVGAVIGDGEKAAGASA